MLGPARVWRMAVALLIVTGCSGEPGGASLAAPSVPATREAPIATPTQPPAPTVPATRPTPAPTLRLPDVTDLFTTTALRIRAEPSPDFIVLAGGYALVSGVGAGIGRFDGTTGELVSSVAIPGDSCAALDTGFGAAWTATCSGDGLARIDAATGFVAMADIGATIAESEASVGAGEGGVWMIVAGSPRQLLRVDPAKMVIAARYDIPGSPTAVRAGLGAVWVSDPANSLVHRVDPATGAIVASIAVGRQPQFIAVGEGSLWTMDQKAGTVSRIDPATNAVSATIRLGEIIQGGDIAVGGGFVWLRGYRTLLFQIDPATNEVVARYGPGAGSGGVAADESAVWITAHDVTTIWRLEYSGVVE